MSGVTTKPLNENQIGKVLERLNEQKNYNLLAISCLLMKATRISDVLNTLKISDVYTENGVLKDEINFVEVKTGKQKILPLKGTLLRASLKQVYKTIKHLDRSKNLFYSQKGKRNGVVMSTVTVNRNLKKFIGMFNIEALSTHAIRKTAGRLMYEKGVGITTISEIYNHYNPKITYIYLAITPQDSKKALTVLEF